jgi:hypothetical protein
MRRLLATAAAICSLGALWAPSALGAFGLSDAGFAFTNQDGSAALQAGGHPFKTTTTLAFNTRFDDELDMVVPDGSSKGLKISLPPGFVGNPTAMPYCQQADVALCPVTTEIGIAEVFAGDPDNPVTTPVYNLEPPPGVAAKLGFIALTVPISVEISVNPNPPYNLVASVENIPQVIPFFASNLALWGTPAEAAHDSERRQCGISCSLDTGEEPFLLLPRKCSESLASLFEVSSWENPGNWLATPASTPGMVGCESLGFGPRLAAEPTSSFAGGPTGLDIEVDVTDEGIGNPKGQSQADIEKAIVTLPEGVTANPALAEALATCSQAQLQREDFDSEPGEGCPQASKIGTVEAQTPLLENRTLKGSLFIATPYENRFGTLLALYGTLREPERGVVIRLEGKVEPDPKTGQLVSTFEDLPQYPVSHFELHLREGGRSPLIAPPRCGTYETKAQLFPSSDPANPYVTTAPFKIRSGPGGSACPGGALPFNPGFEAGALNNNAGSFSPFNMRWTRKDGDQDITRFSSKLPPGMIAKIAGAAQCPDAAIAAARVRSGPNAGKEELASPSCPASSRIGRILAGAGAGEALTYVPGSVYLAGPYNGAPLSAVGVVPAVAGPFDVGVVVTRLALKVDPRSTEVSVDGSASDPIPHILAGIPLKVRDIRAYVDRPNFTLNPTSCEPFTVGATLWGGGANPFSGADDSPLSLSTPFQVANCANLGFKPRLNLKLLGATKRGGFPALRGEYRPRPGDANLEGLALRLPHSAFLEQGHIGTICTRVQFAAKNCPKASIYGSAKAWTPLLDQPLEGPVYLRSSSNPLPDFVAALHGLIDVEAVARIDSKNGGIRATFTEVPDAPLSKVVVSMQGAKKGLIVNSRDLCASPSRANADFSGQNGKAHDLKPTLEVSCSKRKSKKERHR